MCGIAGIYNLNFDLNALLTSQSHRGPDYTGQRKIDLSNGRELHLGHNRLKIICLSDLANQPMVDDSQNHHLVFNGEIFNYLDLKKELKAAGLHFNTSSDSEVLLNALIHWGVGEALNRINGMFAFAYFSHKEEALYLARDRFGVKPLYYSAQNEKLLFASTSRPIADALSLKPNEAYLQRGLQFGIFENGSAETAYQGLQSVRPGHFLKISFAHRFYCQQYCYYDFKKAVSLKQDEFSLLPEKDWLDAIAQHLDDACSVRLQADVPVAVALSGGLDSSTVAALASKQHAGIQAFCFGSPDDKRSEGYLAQRLSTLHGLDTEFVYPHIDEWEGAFWQTLQHQDAPFAGISVVAQFLLYQKIAKHGVKVVLGGQGGDEAFLGYRKFQLFYLRELAAKKDWLKASAFLMTLTKMLWAERARLGLFWKIRSRYTGAQSTTPMLFANETASASPGYSGNIYQRQMEDVLQYSLPTLLRYEDRNSMAHSLESRLPFMDYRLMELACALPVAMKLHKGYGKWVIRHLMKDKMPDDIRLARYKRGFDVAQEHSVFTRLMPSIRQNISDHQEYYQRFYPNIALGEYFSETSLQQFPQRITELTTLLWLGSQHVG